MVYESLIAAEALSKKGIEAEVINCAVIKPIDSNTIIRSAKKTRLVITAEEAQIKGGLGGVVAELLSENLPTPLRRIGMKDRFGESGKPSELLEHFGLTSKNIAKEAAEMVKEGGQK